MFKITVSQNIKVIEILNKLTQETDWLSILLGAPRQELYPKRGLNLKLNNETLKLTSNFKNTPQNWREVWRIIHNLNLRLHIQSTITTTLSKLLCKKKILKQKLLQVETTTTWNWRTKH